jgi:hypothetical protein
MVDENANETFMVDFSDVYEPEALPAGSEVEVRILDAELRVAKNNPNTKFISLRLEVPANPKAKDFYHTLFLVGPMDDAKKANNKKLALKAFSDAFGADLSRGLAVKDLVGYKAWAILDEEDDPTYGKRNNVRRWVVGA